MPSVSESNCYVCGNTEAKYRCPGCRQVTCSLPCVKSHKGRTACTGKRPVTHFIPLPEFNQQDMLSDYRFLEQVERSLYGKKKNRIVHSSSMYPVVVDFLRRGAFKRGVKLKFLSLGMQRRSTNSSMFNRKTDDLTWKVDWLFPLSDMNYSDKTVSDSTVIEEVMKKYLATDASDAIRQSLRKYIMNLDSVRVLMSNELTGSQKKYFIVDTKKTLRDFLVGKTIVEYPTFIVTLEEFLDRYPLISKEDEDALTQQMHDRRLSKFCPRKVFTKKTSENSEKKDAAEGTIDLVPHDDESTVKAPSSDANEILQKEEIENLLVEQMDVTGESRTPELRQINTNLGETSEVIDQTFSTPTECKEVIDASEQLKFNQSKASLVNESEEISEPIQAVERSEFVVTEENNAFTGSQPQVVAVSNESDEKGDIMSA